MIIKLNNQPASIGEAEVSITKEVTDTVNLGNLENSINELNNQISNLTAERDGYTSRIDELTLKVNDLVSQRDTILAAVGNEINSSISSQSQPI